MAEENTTARNTTIKKSRTRSPNYPALNLADAVERAEVVFNELGRSRVGDEDVAKALGYNKLHGKSRTVVSALKKYGLLEPDGDGFRISDDALDIVTLDSDDPDRAKAIYAAALKPTLFAELHETYGDNPPGDSLLRNYLLKKNFNHNVADEVIRVYRDTMDIASRKLEKYTAADEPDEQQGPKMQQEPKRETGKTRTDSPGGAEDDSFEEYLTIPIKGCKVRLLVDGEVTAETLTMLGRHLRLLRDSLPADPAKDVDETDTESDSIIPKEAAGSLLDAETGDENGHSIE